MIDTYPQFCYVAGLLAFIRVAALVRAFSLDCDIDQRTIVFLVTVTADNTL